MSPSFFIKYLHKQKIQIYYTTFVGKSLLKFIQFTYFAQFYTMPFFFQLPNSVRARTADRTNAATSAMGAAIRAPSMP